MPRVGRPCKPIEELSPVYAKNRAYIRRYQKSLQQKIKDEVFTAYGGYVCACCGETEPMFLTIDHVANDGAEHRKSIAAGALYSWLKANDFPDGFQVLCRNCNWGKHVNHGICPHKSKTHKPILAVA